MYIYILLELNNIIVQRIYSNYVFSCRDDDLKLGAIY